MVLKSLIALLALCSISFCDINDLNEYKQKEIEFDKEIDNLNSTNLKYSWIKPIVASYSYSVNDQFGIKNRTRYFRVSLDQPIFKSGGIYFAIKYSNANREFARVATKLKERSLIKSLYESVLNLKKIDLEIKKAKLSIDNAKIDLLRKREQFEAGLIDSSFLDNAILNRSRQKESLIALHDKRSNLLSSFRSLSDKSYKEIELPVFKTILKEEFIDKNLELQKLKKQTNQTRYLKDMTISNYLPTISLFGEYSNKDDSFKIFKQQSKEYKNYGIRVSMPIADINTFRKIEIEKLKYLKSKLAISDKVRALKSEFKSFRERLDHLKSRLEISKKDIDVYRRLLIVTEDGVRAGEKSRLDLKNLQNSYKVSHIQKELIEIDIQLLFVDFYLKMSDEV